MGKRRVVALLRGINVGGNRKVPMAELRALAVAEGLDDVRTYIQSGNLVFSTGDALAKVVARLERAIEERFGFFVDVVVRTAEDWERYATGSPFGDAQAERPHLLQLGLSKETPDPACVKALAARATAGERVALVGDALWVDYPEGVARSKLTPAAIDKAVRSTVTARNWKTVLELAKLLGGAGDAHVARAPGEVAARETGKKLPAVSNKLPRKNK